MVIRDHTTQYAHGFHAKDYGVVMPHTMYVVGDHIYGQVLGSTGEVHTLKVPIDEFHLIEHTAVPESSLKGLAKTGAAKAPVNKQVA